jgi:hypothetical protein
MKATILCVFLGFSVVAVMMIVGREQVITSSYISNRFVLNLFCGGLGVVALLMSMVGLFAHAIKGHRRRDRWKYIVTTSTALILCFFAWTFLGALRARAETRCLSHLKMIGFALHQYQVKHGSVPVQGGKFDVEKIYGSGISGEGSLSEIFICPMTGFTKFWRRDIDSEHGETTYKIVGEIELGKPGKIIMWCPYHGEKVPVAFSDGDVRILKRSELRFGSRRVTLIGRAQYEE